MQTLLIIVLIIATGAFFIRTLYKTTVVLMKYARDKDHNLDFLDVAYIGLLSLIGFIVAMGGLTKLVIDVT